ncbi:hypothetical protein [Parapedobacter indicus]|nr:hypothetical protein [Parapedobacter indicus]
MKLNKIMFVELFIYLLVICVNFSNCTGNPTSKSTDDGNIEVLSSTDSIPFRNMIGINGFDWEYTNGTAFNQQKFELIKTFTGFRQYLDWDRIEVREGFYRFSYDDIYRKNKQQGIVTLTCLQTIPRWFREKYYSDEYDRKKAYGSLRDYIMVPKGADKRDPASYVDFAKLGFQVAARYGKNANINPTLVKAVTWGDVPDVKIGLGTLEYIECGNEPNKDWSGPNAQQTPEEYAAQLSAFYDGHMGTLGEGVGVKSADPSMKVVMAGIASPDLKWVDRMITWCKENRAKDGSYTLCFDVINYHQYSSVRAGQYWGNNPDLSKNHGVAPELSSVGKAAIDFINLSREKADGIEVWVTECGFDVNERSIKRALPIGNKTTIDTQADWILRTALLYSRVGINRVFFYMLNDVSKNSQVQYNSSGLIEAGRRRPSADFLLQARNLIGDYFYSGTINNDPIVDVYSLEDEKIYVLTVPDQIGREEDYTLKLPGISEVRIHHPQQGSNEMMTESRAIGDDGLQLKVTETPVFVEVVR